MSQDAHQGDELHVWREEIRWAAGKHWPDGAMPCEDLLELNIIYYYENIALDTRSIAKPIQDALIGLAYNYEFQIKQTNVLQQNLNRSFRIPNLSPILAAALYRGTEFLHIRVSDLLNADPQIDDPQFDDEQIGDPAIDEHSQDGMASVETGTDTIIQPHDYLTELLTEVLPDQINDQDSQDLEPPADAKKPAWEKFLQITQEPKNELDWNPKEIIQAAQAIDSHPNEDTRQIEPDKESIEPEFQVDALKTDHGAAISQASDLDDGDGNTEENEYAAPEVLLEEDSEYSSKLDEESESWTVELDHHGAPEHVAETLEDDQEIVGDQDHDADGDNLMVEVNDDDNPEPAEPEYQDDGLDDFWDSGIDLDQDDGTDDWTEEYEE